MYLIAQKNVCNLKKKDKIDDVEMHLRYPIQKTYKNVKTLTRY